MPVAARSGRWPRAREVDSGKMIHWHDNGGDKVGNKYGIDRRIYTWPEQ